MIWFGEEEVLGRRSYPRERRLEEILGDS